VNPIKRCAPPTAPPPEKSLKPFELPSILDQRVSLHPLPV
jgi:hypothetical protein